MTLKNFEDIPIIGILRGICEDDLEGLAKAIIAAGLQKIEITMNTTDAAGLIKKIKLFSGSDLCIGAGTVVTMKDLEAALNAGAEFIVTPILNIEVIKYCFSNKIDVYPGALTPTEIYSAWDAGATMVKIFPASVFGPKYFKEIKGPFNQIKLMAVGGVTKDTIGDYFKMGASAAAFGASIFKKEYLINKKYDIIELEIRELLTACKNSKV